MNDEIYENCEILGLSESMVDEIINSYQQGSNVDNNALGNIYKAGTKYGTISPCEVNIYKAGTHYGTISPSDIL